VVPLFERADRCMPRKCKAKLTARLHLVGDGISSARLSNDSNLTDFLSHFRHITVDLYCPCNSTLPTCTTGVLPRCYFILQMLCHCGSSQLKALSYDCRPHSKLFEHISHTLLTLNRTKRPNFC